MNRLCLEQVSNGCCVTWSAICTTEDQYPVCHTPPSHWWGLLPWILCKWSGSVTKAMVIWSHTLWEVIFGVHALLSGSCSVEGTPPLTWLCGNVLLKLDLDGAQNTTRHGVSTCDRCTGDMRLHGRLTWSNILKQGPILACSMHASISITQSSIESWHGLHHSSAAVSPNDQTVLYTLRWDTVWILGNIVRCRKELNKLPVWK